MKLWLLEILACPIDHAYPLELTIFKWHDETEPGDRIKTLMEGFRRRQVLPPKTETPLKIDFEESEIPRMSDDLIIKPHRIDQYLEEILAKIGEMGPEGSRIVQDKSKWAGEEALKLITTQIKDSLSGALKKTQALVNDYDADREAAIRELVLSITPELEFLNRFKYGLEIEDAVIRCPECKRWYPVFGEIPQLLPDGLRKTEEDDAFKSKWGSLYSF